MSFGVDTNPNKSFEVAQPPTDSVSSLSFSPKANFLVATSWDNQVRCWEVMKSGNNIGTVGKAQMAHEQPALCSTWKDDGTTVFTGGCDKQVKMWQLSSGGQPVTVGMHDAAVKDLAWIPEINLLATGSWDKTLRYWDLRQPNPAHVQALPERCYALTVRHPLMVVATADRNLIVYNLQNPQTEFKRISSPLKYQTRCVAASPDQQGFLVGSIEGRVGVHHLDESQKIKNFTFKCHREGNDIYSVNTLNFHPVGKRLRHLTKHPRKKIQELAASILLGLWKKNIIVEQAITDKKNGNSDKKDSVKSVETSESIKVQKGNSVKVGEFCKGETVKLERSNSSTTRKLENVFDSETSSSAKSAKGVDGVKLKNNSDVESIRIEEKVKKEVSGTSDVRRPATNGVATPKMSSVLCKDPLHDKIRELLSEALLKVCGEISEDLREEADEVDPYRLAVLLECALHGNWGKSNGRQKIKYRSIVFNLKDPHNPDFRRKVLLGHIKPEQVVNMTPEEMASDVPEPRNQRKSLVRL